MSKFFRINQQLQSIKFKKIRPNMLKMNDCVCYSFIPTCAITEVKIMN